MGTYLIPNALSVGEAAEYAMPAGGSTMTLVEGGLLVEDPTRTDAEVAALYAGYVPSRLPQEDFRPSLPEAIRTHAGHLRDYEQAIRNGTAVTNAQTTHVIADIITYLRLTEDRL